MRGQVRPINAAAWIQVLDDLSVAHCTSAFLAHTGNLCTAAQNGTAAEQGQAPAAALAGAVQEVGAAQSPAEQGHFYALRRWNGLWYLMDSLGVERTPLMPAGQVPELLSLPAVFLLHLCPRPPGGGRAASPAAFLPIPTKGASSPPVHPAVPAAPAAAAPPRSRSGVPGRRTRSAQAAGIKNASVWTAAFTAAVRATTGGNGVGVERERSIVQTLLLRHAKDLAGKDPNAHDTRRIIQGLVRADTIRNNRCNQDAGRPTKGVRDPYDYPSDTSAESGRDAVRPAVASPTIPAA